MTTMTSTPTPTSTSSSPQMGGKRKLSKWNKFTSKVYATEHRKNKNFKFKDALKMASAMKKKGQYGGDTDGSFSTVPLTTTPEEDVVVADADLAAADVVEDGSLATSQVGQLLAPAGGRRRRRTMRRSRGRSQRRSRGRSRGRGRARASRRR